MPEPVSPAIEGKDAFGRHLVQVLRIDLVQFLAWNRELLHPRHLVFANGLVGFPRIPQLPGLNDFRGDVTHTAGYSQGANVVDNSMGISSDGALVGGPIVATIPASVQPKVAAVLLFGNPIRAIGKSVTGTYAARTDDFCANGDPVCQAGGTNPAAHLSYGNDASAAAAFAAGKV